MVLYPAGEKFEFVFEEAAEKEVEEVMDTRERAKGVEKEKPAEAGEKFEFAEKEVEEVVDTRERAKGVEKEKPAEAGEKFEFFVEEAAETEVEEVMDTRKRAKGVEKEKPAEAGEKEELDQEGRRIFGIASPQGVPKPSSCLDAMECCSHPRILRSQS
jgi:hypothetical protein